MGTFKPVTAERVTDHRMHPEWGEVSEEAAAAAREARRAGHRIVAVGTTTTRLLESAAADGQVRAFRGETDRFIYPGYRFQAVDAMVTNFHLPRSTLLMLACAFAGREFVLSAYAEAVRQEYRFYSFGDAMLIV
jgi:S-adenosylmethionine:tRNA ribosyltransferase-isomerase